MRHIHQANDNAVIKGFYFWVESSKYIGNSTEKIRIKGKVYFNKKLMSTIDCVSSYEYKIQYFQICWLSLEINVYEHTFI